MGRIWNSWRRFFSAALFAAALIAGGCTAFDTPDTYNRHRLSDVTLPRDGGTDIFFFDVTISAEFPDNNATAEAERMKWLDAWMVQKHMCPTGHEIIEKRTFDYLEDNPARRDLRYEARCKPG